MITAYRTEVVLSAKDVLAVHKKFLAVEILFAEGTVKTVRMDHVELLRRKDREADTELALVRKSSVSLTCTVKSSADGHRL